ncbi:hypothetical protein SU69_02190 [Thermosipho melanesiensis]|uniref:UvrD-like helicase C-terminal domain-containing protein n=2 Tax=Thermosipho melanesiensis TaxID=46541 RepID=A6LK37_THEM4|nr:PD-(D/E)XK nuclease family protein [Thermosipho melanesiensis]ABR30288.1 hypothetical protein Tmel_0420 [Thermosipho melanesiensis BI429]APT74819.1 hypothetical protein BW47_02285 [Thermosipho melanesiensis]OOC37411.1 hypothetical protein SU68_02200 [Thermosipho melanesiensis]OOC39773.1 hypothetical protein SU69_02190 [Thermosipho melanesiensis]OOC39878.1 hypothetical protein SU70_02185 [Thermosipho melanesiensis]
MKHAIITDLNEKHFEYIAKEIEKHYDPFTFLFIGPTGYYVRQISDKFSENISKTINRDAFRVVNQYVVETLLLNNMDASFFDRDFFKAFIASQIEEYIRKEKNEEYGVFLRTISKSKGILDYILDLFEKAWEIKVSNSDFLPSYYFEIQKLLEREEKISQLISRLLNDISIILQKSGNIFEQITAYKWYVEEFLEERKNTLVLSGFFDLTPMLKNVFKKMFESFENVFFYIWPKINDRAFYQLEDIYSFLEQENFSFSGKSKGVFHIKDKTKVFAYKNSIMEIYEVSGKIKELVKDGCSPSDIAVIVPNVNVAKQISEKLTEMGIPNNVNLQSKLSESKIVRILLQPLKTIYFNYEIEDILALIESPYINTRELTMDKVEKFFMEFKMIDDEFSKEKINEITEKIKKLEEVEDDDTYQDRMEKIEEYKTFIDILKDVFTLLDKVKEGLSGDFIKWFLEFVKNSIEDFKVFLSNEYEIMEERNALLKFVEVLNNLLSYDLDIKSWRTWFKIINSIIGVEKYRFLERKENAVDIFDITQARFVKKKYKFFVSFLDTYYPSFDLNPLILNVLSNPNKLMAFNEEIERRNIFLSLIFSDTNYITYPHSTLTGEPLLPSVYANEFGIIEKVDSTFYIIPPANKVYSYIDKKLYEAFNDEKSLKLNETWQTNFSVKKLSHTLISKYVGCPFYFYLSEKGKVKNFDENKESLYKGILYHRVLKKYFEEKPNVILKKIVQETYDEIFTDEFSQYSIPKTVNIEKYLSSISNFFDKMEHEYSKLKEYDPQSIFKLEQVYSSKLKDFLVEVRVDRIDILKKENKTVYAIIDYKTKLNKIPVEQLLIYDYVFRKNIKSNETLLVFLGIENENSTGYFLKRIDNTLYYKFKRKEKSINYEYFEAWINNVIENITSGNAKPIFFEEKLRPFLGYLYDSGIEVQKSKIYEKKCKIFKRKCDYYDICKNFEIYKEIRLNEK